MKKIFSILALSAMMIGFASCNEKAKLADRLTGNWTSSPERIATNDTKATTTITRSLTFVTDESSNTGGTIDGAVDFTILTGTEAQAAVIQPISVTAGGKASISGRWEAIDDDEILVTWDYSTMQVTVDPDAVEMEYDVMTEESEPIDVFLKAQTAKQITATINAALSTEVFHSGKIEDIKITNNGATMTCEIDHDRDLTFSKFLH